MRAWPVGFGILFLVASGVGVAIALRSPDTIAPLPGAPHQASRPPSGDGPSQAPSRLSGLGRLRVSLTRAPGSSLEIAVESASENPTGLGKTVLTPEHGKAQWSLDIPASTPCRVRVSRTPDSQDGSFRASAILPIVVDVEPLAERDEREAVIDFAKLPRMSVALQGEAAKLTRVTWHFDSKGLREAHDVMLEPVRSRIDVVAATPGSASFEGVGFGVRGSMRLVDADGRRSFQMESGSEQVALRLEHGEIGSLVVAQEDRRVAFAYGIGGTLSDVKASHPPISLAELKDIGVTEIVLLTSEGCLFAAPILGLKVDAQGEIAVQTPPVSNRVMVYASGDVPEHWSPWITDAARGAIPLAKQEIGWSVQGLSDGSHSLYWIGPPLYRVPICNLELPTSAGERSVTITAAPPLLQDTRVVVENWREVPQPLQRGTLYVEGMPNSKPPKEGVFAFKLARPLNAYHKAEFMPIGAVGSFPGRVTVDGDEVKVRLDVSRIGRVQFVSRLGGAMTVQCQDDRADVRGQSRGAFRTVRASEGTDFLFSGEPTFVRFWEGDQASKVQGYRGTFRLEEGATVADPGGRLLVGVNETAAPILVRIVERIGGERLETTVGICEPGGVSLWIPSSAAEIVVESTNGTRKFPATVESLVVTTSRR